MADYSSSTAQIPESAPRTLELNETIVDATDRDSATPDDIAGAHVNAVRNEVAALYAEVIPDGWGRVTDAGGLDVAVGAGVAYANDGGTVSWAKDSALTLTDDATNYVEVDSSGTLSANTTGFSAAYIPLAEVTTVAGDITAITDRRGAYYVPPDLSLYVLRDGTAAMTGDLDLDGYDIQNVGTLGWQSATELTISSGAVTVTQSVHTIDTEGDAASDDLDTISGGSDGVLIVVRADHADRTVVLKHGTGNLQLAGSDITLDNTDQCIQLLYDGALSKWLLAANPPGSALGNHTLDATEHTDVAAITEAQGQILYQASGGQWDALDPGTANQALLTGGAAADPAWADVLLPDGTVALTADWDVGPWQVRASTFYSDVATGTAPLTVSSETMVANLNADMVDGYEGSELVASAWDLDELADVASITEAQGQVLYYDGSTWNALDPGTSGQFLKTQGAGADPVWGTPSGAGDLKSDGSVALTADWDMGDYQMRAKQFYADVPTGTAPLVISSETVVSNLNVDKVDGQDAADFAAVDGDVLDVDFTPASYTPDASPAEASDVDDLAAHLKGIDTELAKGTYRWLNFVVDGGGSVISSGQQGHFVVPEGTIVAVRLLADQSGSITIDLWKDTHANFPPTDADSICGGNEPALSSAQSTEDTTLTGWTTSLSEGDEIAVNVDSAATITRCTVALKVEVG